MHPSIPPVVRFAHLSNHRPQPLITRHRVLLVALVLSAALLLALISHPTTEAVAPTFAAKQDFATGISPVSVALGDLNGDGRLDLAVANADSSSVVSVLLNTTAPGATAPSFAAKQDFATGFRPVSVTMGDLNGDGKLDLALADIGASSASVLLNMTIPGATTATFAAKQEFTTGSARSVAMGDVNRDGKLDLAVANNTTSNVSVLLNTTAPGDSAPSFAAKQDFAATDTAQSVQLQDLNGDGALDMAVVNGNSNSVSVLLNTTAPGSPTATFGAKQDFGTGANPFNVSIGDLNRDGKPDFVVGNSGSSNVSLLLNTTAPGAATPTFAAKQDFTTGSNPPSVAVGDLNGDGNLDLVATNSGSNNLSVLLNTTAPGNSTLSFAAKQDFASGTGPFSVAMGDLNGDGKLDLVATNQFVDSVSVLLNTTDIGPATPGFTPKQDSGTGDSPFSVATGDFNGDGKLDLAVANNGAGVDTVSVFFNNTAPGATTPSFAAKQDFGTGPRPVFVAVGDLNGDGLLDLAVAATGSTVSVLLNTTVPGAATPSFATKQDFTTGTSPQSVAIGDLNGDGKRDLAIANNGSDTVSVLINTTAPGAVTPSFAAKQDFATDRTPFSVAVGDLNGDGQLDLAVTNNNSLSNSVSVLLNTTAPGATTPGFAAKQDFLTGTSPFSVAVGDFNGDGKLDLAVANESSTASVLLNTTPPGAATPNFAAKQDFATGTLAISVAVGDLNGDGKRDLAIANFSSHNVSVLLNTTAPGATTPSFSAKQDFATGANPRSIALGDLNRDGKADIATSNVFPNTVSVLLNTSTIVAATGLSQQQGTAAGNSQIATVTNYGGNGSVIVTVTSANPANGVTISNIVNTNGNITADIAAGCAATNASFTLQASDGSSPATTTLNVTVIANPAPTLTYSSPQAVALNGSLNVSPTTATDNGSITSYAVQSVSPALTTAPTVNASGVVSITNAQPAGSHVITIRATDDCGATTNAAFTLNVSKDNQTITVGTHAPANATHNSSFTVAATSSSGLPVSYSSAGVCTNVGATFTMTSGTGTCTVKYDQPGDSNYNPAPQVTESVTAQKASSSTGLTSSLNPSFLGQSVTFTATVTSTGGTPAGTVQFKIDGVNSGSPVTLNGSGAAQLTTSSLTAATHTVTADYSGDTNFAVSAGTLAGGQVVNNRPLISLSQSNYSVNEASGFVTVTVNRTGDLSVPVTVDYATSDAGASTVCSALNTGLASSRCDFGLALGTLRFAANETQKTFVVTITQDSYLEGPEMFNVVLSNPAGSNAALASPTNATVTINDSVPPAPNANDDTEAFVRQQYRDFLNRDADASGLAFWKDNIDSCNDPARRPPGFTVSQCIEVRRIDTSAAFFLSIEFQQTGYLVERTYKISYGDASGDSTLNGAHQLSVPVVRLNEFLIDIQRIGQGVIVLQPGWEQALEANKQAYFSEFVQTTRFINAFPTTMTPAEFVDKLNTNAGNALSPSERTTAINLFGGAANSSNVTARAQAVRQVAEDQDLYNAEFNRAFVLAEYFGYLRRNPNDAPESTLDYTGYDFWLTKLNQSNGNYINAEMVKAFLSSIEYRQRFGP
jgi:predicted nucleotidyltransferase